jgi:hypothetical protein
MCSENFLNPRKVANELIHNPLPIVNKEANFVGFSIRNGRERDERKRRKIPRPRRTKNWLGGWFGIFWGLFFLDIL